MRNAQLGQNCVLQLDSIDTARFGYQDCFHHGFIPPKMIILPDSSPHLTLHRDRLRTPACPFQNITDADYAGRPGIGSFDL